MIFISTTVLAFFAVYSALGCEVPSSFCGPNLLELNGYPGCDAKVEKEATTDEPEVSYFGVNEDDTFTLIMVDPDAPIPEAPSQKYWLHWLVSDIKGSDIKNGLISGTVLFEYNGPSPPAGVHRYQFMLLKQPGKVSKDLPEKRGKFNLEQFMISNNLCHIVAGFQYRVQA